MTGRPAPLVSVLMLTCNGGPRLSVVLDAIGRQEAAFEYEIVAVDSGSTDGTVALLQRAGASLLTVPPAEFNHGTTRNLGMTACRGSFVVMLVQDAEPDSSEWLARLVDPLLRDETLAGSCARQVAPENAGSVQRKYLESYAAGRPGPRIQAVAGRDAFVALPGWQQLELCAFDNVCSCVRKSAWGEHPFRRVPIAEDLAWARDVLLAGYRLAYVPDARVRHLHDRSAVYELKRTYLVHQQLRRLFGFRTVPSLPHLARGMVVSLARHAQWVLGASAPWPRKLGELPRAAALAVALPMGQYLGAKSADSGRELLRARGV